MPRYPRNLEFKIAILRSGFQQNELAEVIGKSPSWISQVIYGGIRPSKDEVKALADVLETEERDLGLKAR